MSVTYSTTIPEINARIQAEAMRVVSRRAFDILAKSRATVPVDTGNLKNSGHVEVHANRAVISYSANYAAFVELPTRFTAAQPYLRPAFDKFRPIILADLRGLLR